MSGRTWATAHISYAEDSAWCQAHGHTGLLVGSVCQLCDDLVATDPAFAALLGTVHNPDGSRRSGERAECRDCGLGASWIADRPEDVNPYGGGGRWRGDRDVEPCPRGDDDFHHWTPQLAPLPRPLPPGIGVWLSPNGVEHAIVDGRCATCGRNHLPA